MLDCCNITKTLHVLYPPPDPLTPVNLTVDSVFNSSYSCNLTVSCSTNYFDIISIFKCDSKTCYQEGGEQTEERWWSTAFLHVYLSDGSIICNHSNTGNWTKDMIEIDRFCPQNAGKSDKHINSFLIKFPSLETDCKPKNICIIWKHAIHHWSACVKNKLKNQ